MYYDKVGRIIYKKDRKGIYTSFIYDDAGRLIRKTYSDGITSEDNFVYDKNSRILSANNSVAQLTWQYDKVSRPINYQQVVDGTTDMIKYNYDIINRNMSLTYPDGMVVERKMDFRNRLDSVVIDGNLTAVDYDYCGMAISKKKMGNGVVADYAYNEGGRLSQLTYSGGIGTLPDFSYGYDIAGNMRYIMKNHQTEMSETFEYDSTYQLTRWRRGTLSLTDTTIHSPNYYQEWTLDSRGNWVQFNDNGTVQNQEYNIVNELVNINGAILNYDENGNMLRTNSDSSYIWDAKNLLVTANNVHYQYDALSRRILKENGDGTIDRFVVDGWRSIVEISSNGIPKNTVYSNYLDEILCIITANDTFMVANNHQYSVVNIYNSIGVNVEGYDYTPYGNVRILSPAGNEIPNSVIGNTKCYTAQELDSETGLYYYRYRYYDESIGRFLSEDPLSQVVQARFALEDPINFNTLDFNTYLYVANNPMKWLDAFGFKKNKEKEGGIVVNNIKKGLVKEDPGLANNPTLLNEIANAMADKVKFGEKLGMLGCYASKDCDNAKKEKELAEKLVDRVKKENPEVWDKYEKDLAEREKDTCGVDTTTK